MGQAKRRGTQKERKAQAIKDGRQRGLKISKVWYDEATDIDLAGISNILATIDSKRKRQ